MPSGLLVGVLVGRPTEDADAYLLMKVLKPDAQPLGFLGVLELTMNTTDPALLRDFFSSCFDYPFLQHLKLCIDVRRSL